MELIEVRPDFLNIKGIDGPNAIPLSNQQRQSDKEHIEE